MIVCAPGVSGASRTQRPQAWPVTVPCTPGEAVLCSGVALGSWVVLGSGVVREAWSFGSAVAPPDAVLGSLAVAEYEGCCGCGPPTGLSARPPPSAPARVTCRSPTSP